MEENGSADDKRFELLNDELETVFRRCVNLGARIHDLEMLFVEMSRRGDQFAKILAEALLERDRHKVGMARAIVAENLERLNEINAPEIIKGNQETELQRLQWQQQSLESADVAGHLQDWVSTMTYNQRRFIFDASCGFVSEIHLDYNDGMDLVFYRSAPGDREFGQSSG